MIAKRAICLAALLTALLATGTGASAQYFVAPSSLVGLGLAALDPDAQPAGANRPACKSTIDPYPVVLVNGTFSVSESDFGGMAPSLANAGYCVYTFNYGGNNPNDLIQAIGPIAASAQMLATFVEQVKATTGAEKVDLVGYSQGGMLSEYYTKVLGGARNIHALVALAPTTHGTTLDGISGLAALFPGASQIVATSCPACIQQVAGSPVIKTLDAGSIAQPGIRYTIIETKNETVVTPVGSSFIAEPGVVNQYVQQFCPFDTVDHINMPYDNVVIQLVKNALSPSTALPPNCLHQFPYPTQ
jgi:triacylglycerol esterase/lipase EstA (alpha/beta hydrolase family)